MSRHAQTQVLKLTRELQADPGTLDGLAALPAADVGRLRRMVGDALHAAHQPAFQRAATASALLPAALTARLAQTVIGPYLAARIAAEMPPERAIRLAGHLDVDFLADLCLALDPARIIDTVRGLPDDRTVAVAMRLLERHEYVTLGTFVDVVRPEVLDAVTDRIDDAGVLLRIATTIDDGDRLDDLVRQLDDEQLRAIVEVAVRDREVGSLLTLLADLGPDSRARLVSLPIVAALLKRTGR